MDVGNQPKRHECRRIIASAPTARTDGRIEQIAAAPRPARRTSRPVRAPPAASASDRPPTPWSAPRRTCPACRRAPRTPAGRPAAAAPASCAAEPRQIEPGQPDVLAMAELPGGSVPASNSVHQLIVCHTITDITISDNCASDVRRRSRRRGAFSREWVIRGPVNLDRRARRCRRKTNLLFLLISWPSCDRGRGELPPGAASSSTVDRVSE